MDPRGDRRHVLKGLAANAFLPGLGVIFGGTPAYSRTVPAPEISLARLRARAQSAAGKRTVYDFGMNPPPANVEVWPIEAHTDCSGFVAWCFGLTRWPKQYQPKKFSTDAMYLDAHRAAGSQLFAETATPEAGDVVLYPYYATKTLTYSQCTSNSTKARYRPFCSAGHVALITAVRPDGHYDTIECAYSPWKNDKDAIATTRGESIFVDHARK